MPRLWPLTLHGPILTVLALLGFQCARLVFLKVGHSAMASPVALSELKLEPPVKPHVTRFDLHGGRCCRCRRRVRGRDERQCSNAVGAAGSHLGPRALALAAQFHVELGLSYGKVQRVLEVLFGLSITRGGLAQAVYRVGHALDPTYRALVEAVPRAPVVCPDETGWRVGGVLCWLWVFVAGDVVVYGILPGRGFEEATTILPAEYSGTISRDGWGPYRRYLAARHDSCKAHLLRRCNELLEVAERGAARVPHEVKRILQGALALRDRRDLGEISPHGLAVARGRLEAGHSLEEVRGHL